MNEQTIMENIIDDSSKKQEVIVQTLEEMRPKDYLVPAKHMRFFAESDELMMGNKIMRRIHPHALSQISQRFGIPLRYAKGLTDEPKWGVELLAHNLERLRQKRVAENTYLVRTVGKEIRGVLSDRYQPMDSSILLEHFARTTGDMGCVIQDFYASDVKWHLKVILPTIYNPYADESIAFGMSLSNSDFGTGALNLKSYMLRVLCLNGMVGEDVFRKVHLGKRLKEGNFSRHTYELETKTVASAISDMVVNTMSQDQINERVELIREASKQEVTPSKMFEEFRKSNWITKEEKDELLDVYATADIQELPPGNNKWRVSQALSSLSKRKDSADRKEHLQGVSGKVLTIPPVQ